MGGGHALRKAAMVASGNQIEDDDDDDVLPLETYLYPVRATHHCLFAHDPLSNTPQVLFLLFLLNQSPTPPRPASPAMREYHGFSWW